MLNRLLTDKDREYYKKLVEKMFGLCPEMMAKKIPGSYVQQAFVLDIIGEELKAKPGTIILCVGSLDDTASECLRKLEVPVINIDSAINFDLHTYTKIVKGEYNQSYPDKYDIIFATSVIEHVKDDEQFIKDICLILKSGGLGIITCDFNNDWKLGDKIISLDERFYTKADLGVRLRDILKTCNCDLIDEPSWEGEPDFTLDGFTYNFATFVFRKDANV